MDVNGKPQISRELLQRINRAGDGSDVNAYGTTRHQPANLQRDIDGCHIKSYSKSAIVSESTTNVRHIRRFGMEMGVVASDQGEVYGQNRQPSGRNIVPDKSKSSRQAFNSRPQATFREPPARGYNPYQ